VLESDSKLSPSSAMDSLLRQDKCKICSNLQIPLEARPWVYFWKGFTVASLERRISNDCPYCILISYAIHNLFSDSRASPKNLMNARFSITYKKGEPFFIRNEWREKNFYPIEIYKPAGRWKRHLRRQ